MPKRWHFKMKYAWHKDKVCYAVKLFSQLCLNRCKKNVSSCSFEILTKAPTISKEKLWSLFPNTCWSWQFWTISIWWAPPSVTVGDVNLDTSRQYGSTQPGSHTVWKFQYFKTHDLYKNYVPQESLKAPMPTPLVLGV